MKVLRWIIVMFAAAALFLFAARPGVQEPAEGELWPALTPYKTGYLQVSKLHKIFYQLGGNPNGKPVMMLHGGPGSGCYPTLFQYFNPEKFHVILHDQRGSGKSEPFAELKENTTWTLVEDIEKLRKHLGLGKVILFGGSWGSTLALAYAETYPRNVSGMIMRGVFTSTRAEIDYYYHGGTAVFFPEVHQKLAALMDHPEKKNYPAQLLEKLQSPDPKIRDKYARAWAYYESKIAFLEISDRDIEHFLKEWNPYAFSLIENYYMANDCFLKEGQLLRDAGKLVDIPVIMVNGRYDTICPPITAYKLHRKLPKSRLIIAEQAGHVESQPPIRRELVKAAKEFE
jgi:proline iminopeptidase